ncbi:hypothetical protein PAHAL_2G445400 [Panicum hallii]|uniref:Uncharacterized protein n=1 Tax=Panicum hallii TaxID=206008 RepID=A0A2S3H2C5_9POAL|nr:hypothetical protein PAHAL_2G445400 [Panicum hallii]
MHLRNCASYLCVNTVDQQMPRHGVVGMSATTIQKSPRADDTYVSRCMVDVCALWGCDGEISLSIIQLCL